MSLRDIIASTPVDWVDTLDSLLERHFDEEDRPEEARAKVEEFLDRLVERIESLPR